MNLPNWDDDDFCLCLAGELCCYHDLNGGGPPLGFASPTVTSGVAVQFDLFTGEAVDAAWSEESPGVRRCLRCGRVLEATKRPRKCACGRKPRRTP